MTHFRGAGAPVVLAVSLLLAACAPPSAPASPPSPSPVVVERVVERVVVVTATAEPEATATPQSPAATPLATEPPVCEAPASTVEVYAVGYAPDGRLMVTLRGEGRFEDEEYLLLVDDSPLECSQLAEYPDRLYCLGPARGGPGQANLELVAAQENCPLFDAEVLIPPTPTAPRPPEDGSGPAPPTATFTAPPTATATPVPTNTPVPPSPTPNPTPTKKPYP